MELLPDCPTYGGIGIPHSAAACNGSRRARPAGGAPASARPRRDRAAAGKYHSRVLRPRPARSSAASKSPRPAWLALAACGVATPALAAGLLPLGVELRARAFVPGEPLRIEVTAPEPLAHVEGAFLGRHVSLVRAAGQATGGERWSGWTMIALDQPPVVGVLEIQGRSAAGRPVGATRAVTVGAASFPRETLSVAPSYVEPPPAVVARLERERRKLEAVYRSRRAVPLPEHVFLRPVPGELTSVFGTERIYNGQRRSPHPGIDLRAASGTAVRCSGAGRAVLAEELYYSGNTVIVDHGAGLFTIYAHLSVISVKEGAEVSAGQLIGSSGATGRVTGPHLHWGAKLGELPFDPEALLDERLFAAGR